MEFTTTSEKRDITLKITTPHVPCPNHVEEYEVTLSQDILREFLVTRPGNSGTLESLHVKRVPGPTTSSYKHGFDLSQFKEGGFQKVLEELSISTMTEKSNGQCGFIWTRPSLVVVTGNNPISGEHWDDRAPEKNYASYIGIESTDRKQVDHAAALIRQHASVLGHESRDERGFI